MGSWSVWCRTSQGGHWQSVHEWWTDLAWMRCLPRIWSFQRRPNRFWLGNLFEKWNLCKFPSNLWSPFVAFAIGLLTVRGSLFSLSLLTGRSILVWCCAISHFLVFASVIGQVGWRSQGTTGSLKKFHGLSFITPYRHLYHWILEW